MEVYQMKRFAIFVLAVVALLLAIPVDAAALPDAAPPDGDITALVLSTLVGAGLSMAASYLPGFSPWFEGLDGIYKRLVLLAGLLVAAVGIGGLACSGLYDVGVVCNQVGITAVVEAFIGAAIANQATYIVTK